MSCPCCWWLSCTWWCTICLIAAGVPGDLVELVVHSNAWLVAGQQGRSLGKCHCCCKLQHCFKEWFQCHKVQQHCQPCLMALASGVPTTALPGSGPMTALFGSPPSIARWQSFDSIVWGSNKIQRTIELGINSREGWVIEKWSDTTKRLNTNLTHYCYSNL